MSRQSELAQLGRVFDTGPLSNRNLIINGAMQVWQRGTSGFGHNTYSADRWTEGANTNDVLAISRVDLPSAGEAGLPRQFTYMAKFALTAGTTGNLNDLRQKVENPKGLAGQTLTLSYYIKASSSCTINNRRVGFIADANAPSGTNLPSLNVTTGWQRVENTFTLGSADTAVYSNSSYLDVMLGLPVNTTVDVYITGVQLEIGDTATPFEHRSYGQELALCQRYYETTYPNGAAVGSVNDGPIHFRAMPSGAADYRHFSHKVEKRASPTMIAYNGITGASGSWRGSSSQDRTITLTSYGTSGFRAQGWSLGDYVQLGHFTADAEL